MNMRHARLATAVVGTIAATTALTGVAPAATVAPTASHVTATPSTTTPASGETFRVRGAVLTDKDVRVPATIHVKTWRNGRWVQLRGAVMHTNRDNGYHMRIILQMKGERQLRVVGDPDSATIATARTTFTVTVH
jgi:hypothetical protein